MRMDPTDYLQLDAPQCLGATSAGASFATSSGDIVEIECFGDGAFRLRSGPNTRPDYGIVTGTPGPCAFNSAGESRWSFGSGRAALEVSGPSLALRLMWEGRPVLISATDERANGSPRLPALGRLRRGGLWSTAFALVSGEPVYGLGEKFGPLDKRGQLVQSRVVQPMGVNTGRSSRSTPFAWSPGTGAGAWGIFVHTPGSVTHAVGNPDWSHRSYALMVEDEALDLFLFAADLPEGIIDLYTQVTGRPRAVPRWSLGLWVGRPAVAGAAAAGPDDAEALVAAMRERRLPCDVVSFGAAGAGSAGAGFDFTWDPLRHPDPAATLDRIKAHGVRVCLRETPLVATDSPLYDQLASSECLLTRFGGEPRTIAARAVRDGASASDAGAEADVLDAGTTGAFGMLDFTVAEAHAWWRDAHRGWFEDGVDAFECEGGDEVPDDARAANGDGGARLHNVYPLLHQRCVFEASEHFARPESTPPLLASHAGWAGAQRFPLGFADDAQADWEGLAASIRGALSWAMSGGACHGLSIGAHHGSHAPAGELFVRWLQAGVFASHLRLVVPPGHEPWHHGAGIEAIARKWIALRYRLIPYLDLAIRQAVETGAPVMRAMPLAFPHSTLLRRYETQFLCGDALLVAPIVREGGEVEIALPPGGWYDLNTRERFGGPRVLRYAAQLDQFPVFGREGYALPLGRSVQHTGESDPARPIEALWLFGATRHALAAHGQIRIEIDAAGVPSVYAAPGVDVQAFGDGATSTVHRL